MKSWQIDIFLGKSIFHAHAYSRRTALIGMHASQWYLLGLSPTFTQLIWKISLTKYVQLSVRLSDINWRYRTN